MSPGYGIIQEVTTISAGRVNLLPGTLYTALDRLTAQELVERLRDEVVDGRLRRYYGLSDKGITVLETEAKRLQGLATAATARLRRLKPRTVS